MLGANIGTTISTYVYTINQNAKVKKLIIINILFNLFGSLLFISFIDHFIWLLNIIKVDNFKDQVITIAHLIFNLLTTLLIYFVLIPFKFNN